MRVGSDARPGKLAVDPGSTRLSMLQGLDDQDGGAFAQHEAVSVDVPWPRCPFRFIIAAAHGLHLGKAGNWQRMNDALSATYDGNVGAAKAQHVQAKRDRLVARCA